MVRSNNATRSIATNWVALAVNIVTSFFLAPFVVNKLGNVYYGIWAVTMQFTGYLYLLDFGVRESVIRYTAKYVTRVQPRKLNDVLTTSLIIYTPVTLGCVLLSAVCIWGMPYWFNIDPQYHTEARWAAFFVGLTIAQTFLFNVFTGVLQGLHRFDIVNVVGIGLTVIRVALIVVLLNHGYGLIALSAIQFSIAIASGVVITVAALRLLRKSGTPFHLAQLTRRRFSALAKRVLGYGFFVLINNVAQKVIIASAAIIVAVFMPIAAVTYYAIAGNLIEYLRTLVVSAAQVFNPLSSQLQAARRSEEIGHLMITGSKLSVLLTLPIATTYAVLGREFIGLWMGEQFMGPAGDVLIVLALTQILSSPNYVVGSVLYGISKHRELGFLRMGEAAGNLILSIILVQHFGLVGVALGAIIPHIVVVLGIVPRMACRTVNISVWKYLDGTYRGPLLATIPFVAGAFWFRAYVPASNLLVFFVQVAALVVVYAATAYAVALDSSERAFIKRLLLRGKPTATAS